MNTEISQKFNHAGRDIIAGNSTYNHTEYKAPPQNPLAKMYERLNKGDEDRDKVVEISHKLQHYLNVSTDGDVRGLEEKLRASGRIELLPIAKRLKESSSMLIMRWQTSISAQEILTYILSQMWVTFITQVQPSIEAGESRQVIDSLTQDKVLQPIAEILGENSLSLDPSDLFGLLFFLAGNCHIRWDKC